MTKSEIYSLIGLGDNSSWTGAPTTLSNNQKVGMTQTPNGSSVLVWQNMDKQNSDGTLALTSGGSQPQFLDAPALANAPSVMSDNWAANNLNLTNISANTSTTIMVELFGPGIPGFTPVSFPVGSPVALAPGTVAQGTAQPNWMQLKMQSNASTLTIFAVIGGPPDAGGSNAYVFALNYAGTGTPPGFTKVTAGNTLSYQFNWGSSTIFAANMSPSTSATANVVLISL